MLKQEFYKLFVKRFIIFLFVIFVLIKVCVNILGFQPSTFTDKQQIKYQNYTQYLSGKLTNEKAQFILSERDAYLQSSKRIEQATADYADNKLTDIEYEILIEKESEYIVNEPVFKEILKQYNYVLEDTEHRYFINYTGWNSILCNESFDYILLFFLLISITIIFSCEYDSGMYVINLTCKYGYKKLAKQKISIGILLSVFGTLVFSTIDIISTLFQSDLMHGDYPIQSLPYFSTYSGNLSLMEILFITIALKILGCCYFATLIMCVSVISKSTIITLFFNLAINIIPYVLNMSPLLKLLLPLPGGLLNGSGYFVGYSIIHNNKEIIRTIQPYELIIIILTVLLVMIISLRLTQKFYNTTERKRVTR